MIITAKTPGAAKMRLIDADGTDLTSKYYILSFDTETGEATVIEKGQHDIEVRGIGPKHHTIFPNAKIVDNNAIT